MNTGFAKQIFSKYPECIKEPFDEPENMRIQTQVNTV